MVAENAWNIMYDHSWNQVDRSRRFAFLFAIALLYNHIGLFELKIYAIFLWACYIY